MPIPTPNLGLAKADIDADILFEYLGTDLAASLDILDAAVTLTGTQTLTNKTLTAPTIGGTLAMSTAASKIKPGATSLSLRNNADNADNVLIEDAGQVTLRGALVVNGVSTDLATFGGKLTVKNTTSGGRQTALVLVNAAGAAGTAVSLDFTPNTNIALARINALRTAGSGTTDFVWSLYDGSALIDVLRLTSARQLQLFNAYTDDANYERGAWYWASNVLHIVPQAAGTGTVRATVVGGSTITFRSSTSMTDKWLIDATGHLVAQAAVYVGLTEMADPGGGAANSARLYARDNGSGKTQLVVVFGSGAAQVLATEP